MKVIVTLDYWDGEHLVRETDAEALPRFLTVWLAQSGVAGITITRKDSLKKISREMRAK